MPSIDLAGWKIPVPLLDGGVVALAVAIALVLHWAVIHVLRQVVKRTRSRWDDVFVGCAVRPLRWILVAIALAYIRSALHLTAGASAMWSQAAGLIVPALIGWLAVAMIRAGNRVIELRADISVADNLRARRMRTRSAILGRIAIFAVAFLTICLMLLSIPSVRSVGVTLMASAGLAGLAVGAAAQPALKNLIAGIQLAFTEPIHIDDVVIIDEEWGRIEEIRLTYAVVAIWDQRRLVVPISRFLESSFQNWTRTTSEILGTAFFHLDPTADIGRFRAHFESILQGNPRWDRRVGIIQVTETSADSIEVRALVSASDAGRAFDLRCDVREAMLAFLRDAMPEALPRNRTEIATSASLASELAKMSDSSKHDGSESIR